MLNYTIELTPRNGRGIPTTWEGPAVNIIDAIQLAKASVFPKLHIATVVQIGEQNHGEQEGNQR